MANEKLTDVARTLSSGTIATLTGLRKYDELEKVQHDFWTFTLNLDQDMIWQPAWELFIEEYKKFILDK